MTGVQTCALPIYIRRLNGSTGINQTTAALPIKVFPNPAKEIVMIDLGTMNSNSSLKVTLMDSEGRKIMEQVINKNQIQLDLKGVAPGMYCICVTNTNQEVVSIQSLVIQE